MFSWLPDLCYNKGHCTVFHYKAEDLANVPRTFDEEYRHIGITSFTNRYLLRVRYENTTPHLPMLTISFRNGFDYGEYDPARPDPNNRLANGPFAENRSQTTVLA